MPADLRGRTAGTGGWDGWGKQATRGAGLRARVAVVWVHVHGWVGLGARYGRELGSSAVGLLRALRL